MILANSRVTLGTAIAQACLMETSFLNQMKFPQLVCFFILQTLGKLPNLICRIFEAISAAFKLLPNLFLPFMPSHKVSFLDH